MWTGSVMVAVASDFVQIDGIERARRRSGFGRGRQGGVRPWGREERASPLSISLRCQRGGRAGARLCSDAARGTGEDDRTGTGPLSRFGGKARGAGRIPFYIVLLVFQCILICFSFLTPFSIYSYQLNDLYS